LAYPGVGPIEVTRLFPELASIGTAILEQLSIDAQYAVYLDRQKADVEAMRRDEGIAMPTWLDYAKIPGLSHELRQKLGAQRPATLAQAQAIEGMTPAAATLLLAIIRRGGLRKAG
jgi:tRNA uridine 5-carboxymethylaminomethyl modification enzyme